MNRRPALRRPKTRRPSVSAASQPRARDISDAKSALRGWMVVTLSVFATLAPLLTMAYYVSLSGGDLRTAQKMLLLSDPAATALAVTTAFYPALLLLALVAAPLWLERVGGPSVFPLLAAALLLQFMWQQMTPMLEYSFEFHGLRWVQHIPTVAAVIWMFYFALEGPSSRRVRRRPWERRGQPRLVWALWLVAWAATVLLALAFAWATTLWQFREPTLYHLSFDAADVDAADPDVYLSDSAFDALWYAEEAGGTWYLRIEREAYLDFERRLLWQPRSLTMIEPCDWTVNLCYLGYNEWR